MVLVRLLVFNLFNVCERGVRKEVVVSISLISIFLKFLLFSRRFARSILTSIPLSTLKISSQNLLTYDLKF